MSFNPEHLSGTNYASQYEPPPIPNSSPSVHDLVMEDMQARKEMGVAKYGVTLQAFNGRRALIDAYQEILDLAVYLKQQIEEDLQKKSKQIQTYTWLKNKGYLTQEGYNILINELERTNTNENISIRQGISRVTRNLG